MKIPIQSTYKREPAVSIAFVHALFNCHVNILCNLSIIILCTKGDNVLPLFITGNYSKFRLAILICFRAFIYGDFFISSRRIYRMVGTWLVILTFHRDGNNGALPASYLHFFGLDL